MAEMSGRFESFMVNGVLIKRWRLYIFRFLGLVGSFFTIQTVSEATSKKLAVVPVVALAVLAINFWIDWHRTRTKDQWLTTDN